MSIRVREGDVERVMGRLRDAALLGLNKEEGARSKDCSSGGLKRQGKGFFPPTSRKECNPGNALILPQ